MALELKAGMRVRILGLPATVQECGHPNQIPNWKGYRGPENGAELIETLNASRIHCLAFILFDDYSKDGKLPILLWRGYWWTSHGLRLDDIQILEPVQ